MSWVLRQIFGLIRLYFGSEGKIRVLVLFRLSFGSEGTIHNFVVTSLIIHTSRMCFVGFTSQSGANQGARENKNIQLIAPSLIKVKRVMPDSLTSADKPQAKRTQEAPSCPLASSTTTPRATMSSQQPPKFQMATFKKAECQPARCAIKKTVVVQLSDTNSVLTNEGMNNVYLWHLWHNKVQKIIAFYLGIKAASHACL